MMGAPFLQKGLAWLTPWIFIVFPTVFIHESVSHKNRLQKEAGFDIPYWLKSSLNHELSLLAFILLTITWRSYSGHPSPNFLRVFL
jgi:hypothetical protein